MPEPEERVSRPAHGDTGSVFAGASRAAGYVESEPAIDSETAGELLQLPVNAPDAPEIQSASTSSDDAGSSAADGTGADVFSASIGDLSKASAAAPELRAKEGFRGALNGLGFRLAPGEAELRQIETANQRRQDEETIRQATWTRAVSILVANRKGGVGKTPVSILLGGSIASIRGGSVAIVEVSDDPGALSFRAEGQPQLGIGELVRDARTVTSAGQLAGYTAPQTSFASVIGSVGNRKPLTGEDVKAVAQVVDEYFTIRVMDSGNQPSSSAFRGAVETADALVIPIQNAGDAVLDALALLDHLRAQGGHAAELARRAIFIRLTDNRPEYPQVMERINRIIAGSGVTQTFAVPYDAHIAERGQLTLSSLNPATHTAFISAAAGVVRSINTRSITERKATK
ncbi:hypothetical protein [Subtercola sp. RTI3]|uniref:ParA family protein n=1 Tax=Subtercola sp. RTI3 TaxID=3048639 RepID=UPI002B23E521|nr:hypothetical protein [Subtercola sp. RTI3]MEA9986082.1 hypothetical protein [Subtercola sp. RTI3]